jgi:hypothetical protein
VHAKDGAGRARRARNLVRRATDSEIYCRKIESHITSLVALYTKCPEVVVPVVVTQSYSRTYLISTSLQWNITVTCTNKWLRWVHPQTHGTPHIMRQPFGRRGTQCVARVDSKGSSGILGFDVRFWRSLRPPEYHPGGRYSGGYSGGRQAVHAQFGDVPPALEDAIHEECA